MVNDTVTVEPCAPLLSNTVPAITPFSVKLTGLTQTVDTGVGAWRVTDASGSNAGYSVTAAATAPTVNGSASAAGTGQGEWDSAADSGTAGTGSLAIVIPGDASAGNYSSTLTFTTAPPAG
jgi:hypothetical protein